MPLNINLDTTTGLKFQQPNIPPGRTAMEGLAAGLGPVLQQVPSLMMQYQQLKQQRQLADANHQVALGELERRAQEDKYTQAANRVKSQLELLGLGRSQVSVSPTGEKTEFPGVTGWEVTIDENGLPSLIRTGDSGTTVAPGVSRVIGSPGQAAINVPKSEFIKDPEKFKNAPGLKIVDDMGMDANSSGKKQLPPDKVMAMTDGASVLRMLPDLSTVIEDNKDMFGPIKGRIKKANVYDVEGQSLDAKIRAMSQAFGRFMEGGVLRKEDEIKYYKMFPQLSDNPEVAKNKLKNVSDILARQYEDKKKTLNDSNFDVSGLLDMQKMLPQTSGPVKIKDDIEYNALPSGSEFIAPDGTKRRKP